MRQAIDADPEVHFLKTHELASDDDGYPSIYVVRDGRDAVVSFAHYLIDFVVGRDESAPSNSSAAYFTRSLRATTMEVGVATSRPGFGDPTPWSSGSKASFPSQSVLPLRRFDS